MKTIYQCEICGRQYESRGEAERCENSGRPAVSCPARPDVHRPLRPAQHLRREESYVCVTPHVYRAIVWACTPTATCSGRTGLRTASALSLDLCNAANRDLPSFARMAEYQGSQPLPVRYWNGQQIVTLEAAGRPGRLRSPCPSRTQ